MEHYTRADVENMMCKIAEAVGEEEYNRLLEEYAIDGFAIAYDEVMAGGLPDEAITQNFLDEFGECLEKIIADKAF